jgi:hypothetical protein
MPACSKKIGTEWFSHHYQLFAGVVWSTQVFLATRSFWVSAG